MREFERLLPTLEPPAGGLAHLQRSIATEHRRVHWPRWRLAWAATTACVLMAALAMWAPAWVAQRQQAAAFTAALRQSLLPQSPADGIRVAHGAAIELRSGQDNVKLYLVQSAPSGHR